MLKKNNINNIMNNTQFAEKLFTIIEQSYQGILNEKESRKFVMNSFINSRQIKDVEFVDTIELDLIKLRKEVKQSKGLTTQNIEINKILLKYVYNKIFSMKRRVKYLIWNLQVSEGVGLGHYACLSYDPYQKTLFYFDPGYSSVSKYGIYNQVYKTFGKRIQNNATDINFINVSVPQDNIHVYPIQQCSPTLGHKLDAFCQTWTIWWSMMFCLCKNPLGITETLFSLPLDEQKRLSLLMAVAIITNVKDFDLRLEAERDDIVKNKTTLISKLTNKQRHILTQVNAVTILKMNALKTLNHVSKNVASYDSNDKIIPWEYPVFCK